MGLDNLMYLSYKGQENDDNTIDIIEELDLFRNTIVEIDSELLYFRKYWNLRNDIMREVFDSVDDVITHVFTKEGLEKMRDILIRHVTGTIEESIWGNEITVFRKADALAKVCLLLEYIDSGVLDLTKYSIVWIDSY